MRLLKLCAKINPDSQMTGAANSHYRKACNHQDWQAKKMPIPRTEGCFRRMQHTEAVINHLAKNRDETLPLATTRTNLALIIHGEGPLQGFPDSSAGKESTCNAGGPGSIPGSGRSAGEGIGYSLQYSWASLVAQLVKNPPAMWETWVPSLGWEDPLEKGKAIHSSILAWRIPWTPQFNQKESDTTKRLSLHFRATHVLVPRNRRMESWGE